MGASCVSGSIGRQPGIADHPYPCIVFVDGAYVVKPFFQWPEGVFIGIFTDGYDDTVENPQCPVNNGPMAYGKRVERSGIKGLSVHNISESSSTTRFSRINC